MQDQIEHQITELDKAYNTHRQDTSKLEGQKQVLIHQIDMATVKIAALTKIRELDEKGIEVLNLVQRSTRDKVKEAFENMVTFALNSIYQKDYKFQLQFNTRGNLGEMDFLLKTPDNEEFRDLNQCTAGGSFDIISLALRFVLLQVIRPKIEGFVVLDEPCKMLSKNLVMNEFNFYKHISEKLGRQLIIITHCQEIIDAAENKIKVG